MKPALKGPGWNKFLQQGWTRLFLEVLPRCDYTSPEFDAVLPSTSRRCFPFCSLEKLALVNLGAQLAAGPELSGGLVAVADDLLEVDRPVVGVEPA